MKILLVGNYANDRQESMQRFAETLRAGLAERGDDVTLLRPREVLGRFRPGGSGLGKWLGYIDKFVLFPRELRRLAADADLVHICDHSNAMYVAALKGRPHAVTCHDFLAIRSAKGEFPQNPTSLTGRSLQQWILSGLKTAQYVTAVSCATQRDLLRLTGRLEATGEVIHNGMNQSFAPMATGERIRILNSLYGRLRIERPIEYLFHVGGNQWYKNRSGILSLFAKAAEGMGSRLKLVLAGAPLLMRHRQQIEALGIASRVVFVGKISSEELRALYSGAEALVFPSLAEGFGWPIVEAQACGCRVITSNCAPMDEVGGAACIYIDPNDLRNGALRMIETLSESALAKAARVEEGLRNAQRFETSKMIEQYRDVYQRLLGLSVDAKRTAVTP